MSLELYLANVRFAVFLTVIWNIILWFMYYYQSAKLTKVMKFLREKKLIQAWADYRAKGLAGWLFKKEELE